MSKIIKLTPDVIEECIDEFKKDLASSKLADGKINFSKTLGVISRKAKIYFSEVAWMKMQALVREFEKEVAWHGVAFRGDDESKDEYIIKDILVYPQQVSGASVEMDTAEYADWIANNIEDERFFDIRMQGHSHVNMGVSPSSVDLTHQEAILEQLSDDKFYIFMIWNKRGDKNIKIYDLAKNVLFETSDIEVEVLDDGYGINAFVKDAKSMVKEKYTYSGYNYQNNTYAPPSTYNKGAVSNCTKEKETVVPVVTHQKNKTGKRKGKKKNKNKASVNTLTDDQTTIYDDSDDYYSRYLRFHRGY